MRILTKFMALSAWFLLLTATPTWTQQSSDGAPGLYNPRTVETVGGLVISGPAPTGKEGLPEPVHLTLKTEKGKVAVLLGPRQFVDRQQLKISPLDQIEVTGSRVQFQGKAVIIAAEIRKGQQVMQLRDLNGGPLWGSRGQRR